MRANAHGNKEFGLDGPMNILSIGRNRVIGAVLIQVVHWVFLRAIETDHSDFVPGEKKDLSGSFSTFS